MFLNTFLVHALEQEVCEKLKRELYINGGISDIVDKLFDKRTSEEQTTL